MSGNRRTILTQVAEGTISPEEAAERLDELERIAGSTEEEPPPGTDTPIARVRVIGSFRTTKVIGDPEVREAVADGPHVARREGDTLIVMDETTGPDVESYRFGKRDRHIVIGLGSRPRPIEVRMNPNLPLDVELAAGTLNVRGVRGPIRARVDAGTARIEGFRAPLEVDVTAGSLQASGVLAGGESRVRCEAGSVKMTLERGSSVRIRTRVGIGKVVLPDASVHQGAGFRIGAGSHEAVVGDGEGSLEIETSLGSVSVSAE